MMISDAVLLAIIGAGAGILALALKLWRSSSCEIVSCCGGLPFHLIYCKRNTDHEKEIIPTQNLESPRGRLDRQNSISNINVV